MKAASAIILLVCAAIFVGSTIYDHQRLPEKVASHFDGNGVANGWMPRSSLTKTTLVVGMGIPAFVIGILYAIRFFPARFLNVPNPSYWRQPRNFRTACDFLFVSSLWFGSAFLLWQAFFSRMIRAANSVSPPHLDNTKVILLTIPLLIVIFVWIVILVARFLRTEKCGEGKGEGV